MSTSGIQGQPLEVTVVACTKLKDTEWISRQDPYVCVEYGSTKFRTRTCTDGGKNPTFQEKFMLTLIEGLREINVVVWNSNTLTYDDFIGSGKILLQKVLSNGYDDSSWPLQDKKGRHAGEIKLIMHCSSPNKPAKTLAPSAPPYPAMPAHQALITLHMCHHILQKVSQNQLLIHPILLIQRDIPHPHIMSPLLILQFTPLGHRLQCILHHRTIHIIILLGCTLHHLILHRTETSCSLISFC